MERRKKKLYTLFMNVNRVTVKYGTLAATCRNVAAARSLHVQINDVSLN